MRRPELIVFDVNETLSDTAVLATRFEEVGAPGHLAATWFTQVLRDGFALTVTGDRAPFATIGAALLDVALDGVRLTRRSRTPRSTCSPASPRSPCTPTWRPAWPPSQPLAIVSSR